MTGRLKGFFQSFAAETRGAVMIVFAAALIPLLVGVGLSVDYSRALTVKQRLGQALDAAALAAGSWPDLTETQIETKVQEFLTANYPSLIEGSPSSFSVTKTDEVISITASSNVDTVFLKLAGINQVDVTSFTEVALKQKKIELVMVLDNTGSMSWSGKIDALRDAATTMVEILKPGSGSAANSEDVKIGLVPFAAAVNIGADKLGSGWLDETAQTPIATEDFQPGTNPLTLYGQITDHNWNGCVRARAAPYDTQDDPPSTGNPNTLWAPYFAPDEPDFYWYSNRYASDNGYGGSYWDYDARQRYAGKYVNLTIGSGSDGPDFNCKTSPLTPLTATKSTILLGINQMIASGNTVIPAGLAWGWRVISPGIPFTEGAAYDDTDVVKAIILLTDGENMVSGGMGTHNRSQYSAYGYARSGHLGATSGWQAEEMLDSKTAQLCTNIKAQGIRLYTITFQLSDGPIKDLMRDCATEPAMYYDSPSNAELETVFEDIAKGLNDLRISK